MLQMALPTLSGLVMKSPLLAQYFCQINVNVLGRQWWGGNMQHAAAASLTVT